MNPPFVETKLVTRYGLFMIRVYSAPRGLETVVLFNEGLDPAEPILTRVHSECLTGDVFGSLYCDCGEQLHRSLERLQKEKGVCLYLRQEGRGIGLFEKMKAYQLQREGFDTYEANIKLGHAPDERTYEMVKIALDDLRIKKIRLLTNNSAKAAAIQSLGVEVVECVPVVIPSNEYNQAYLHAKQSRLGV